MPAKKPASTKRTQLPRAADFTRQFLQDWERLTRAGRHDMNQLKYVMLLLVANDAPLGPEWLDHPLKGEWVDYRECHIGGNFLLIYQLHGKRINFVRTGTHAELFEG